MSETTNITSINQATTADARMTGASTPPVRITASPVGVHGEKLLLVDFENVPQFSLAKVKHDVRIIIYVGASQKSIPVELVAAAQSWGNRLQWQRVSANGPNALDFFIACKLGQMLEVARHTQCLVLSKDKGFDPLIRHLNSLGLKCARVERMGPVAPKPEPAKTPTPKPQPTPPVPPATPKPSVAPLSVTPAQAAAKPVNAYDRALANLRKSPTQSRPGKRGTLKNHLANVTQKKLTDAELEKLIARLQSEKRITFDGEKIKYTL